MLLLYETFWIKFSGETKNQRFNIIFRCNLTTMFRHYPDYWKINFIKHHFVWVSSFVFDIFSWHLLKLIMESFKLMSIYLLCSEIVINPRYLNSFSRDMLHNKTQIKNFRYIFRPIKASSGRYRQMMP